MSKEEFSSHSDENDSIRRGGQKQGSFGGKERDQQVGAELRKEGTHSKTGIGDEKIPIRENPDE